MQNIMKKKQLKILKKKYKFSCEMIIFLNIFLHTSIVFQLILNPILNLKRFYKENNDNTKIRK